MAAIVLIVFTQILVNAAIVWHLVRNFTAMSKTMNKRAKHRKLMTLRVKNVSDGSANSVAKERLSLARTSQSRHHNNSNSNTYGLNYVVKSMIPGVPLLLSLGMYGCFWGLSWLASWYGVTNHLAGNLPNAQIGYKIALKLTPWSAAAHYNQGSVYEDEQNYQQAHTEYQAAIEGGLIPAYSNRNRSRGVDHAHES